MKSALVSVVVFLPSTGVAFVAPPSQIVPTAARPTSMQQTKDDDNKRDEKDGGAEWNIGSPTTQMLETARKRQLARNAINKLLEKQRRDLQQTLDLLTSIDDSMDNDDDEISENDNEHHRQVLQQQSTNHDENESDISPQHSYITSSIIASVASGVDYGYTSRSEGCRSEAIKKQSSQSSSYNIDARFEGYGPPGNIFA